MEKSTIIISIVVALVFLIVGGVVGMAVQKQTDLPQVAELEKTKAALNGLKSKVVTSIVAYGKVESINGKNITLSYSGDKLTVKIKENSNIYSFSVPEGSKATTPTQQKAAFTDIKKGDNVNISVKLSPEGELEGQSIMILPSVKK